MYKQRGIILIDDEVNILKSIERLLKNHGFEKVWTASSAIEAAAILKQHANEIVLAVTDERMPKIKGSDFVKFIRANYPHVVRIVLTGYSEPEAMLKSINEGEVFRYLTKPWDDEMLLNTMIDTVVYGAIKQDNERLQMKLMQKNKQLEEANNRLETVVSERTEKLERSLLRLKELNNDLKAAGQQGIRIIALFMESLDPGVVRRGQELVDLVHEIVETAELTFPDFVYTAALFHDVKNINHPPLRKSIPKIFNLLPAFRPVQTIIERIHMRPISTDPLYLEDLNIDLNLAARIIAFIGALKAAKEDSKPDMTIRKVFGLWKGLVPHKIYNIAETVFTDSKKEELQTTDDFFRVATDSLEPGQVLAQGIYTRHGMLLLPPKTKLDERQIEVIRDHEDLQVPMDGIRIYKEGTL